MNRMMMQGINEEIYLQYANTTKEDIVSHMKEEALKRLKNSYLLNAIIKEENIDVTEEEINNEIASIAKEHNATEEDVRNAFGGNNAIAYDLKVRRAIELMKETKEDK